MQLAKSMKSVYAMHALEVRRLLFSVQCTDDADIINISASESATHINVNAEQYVTSDFQIFISAKGGGDLIRINSILIGDSFLTISGGEGDDLLLNPTLFDIDLAYGGQVDFDGGEGRDTILIDNSSDSTTTANIDFDQERLEKNGIGVLFYTNINQIQYFDSNGSNRIGFHRLRGIGRNIGIAVHGEGGNDTITNTLSNTQTVGAWEFSVATTGVLIDGGTGTDTLRMLCTNDQGPREFSFTTGEIDEVTETDAPLTYSECEAIDFLGTPEDDVIDLLVKPAATTLRFDGAGGDDEFEIGNGDLDSNGWRATTILGGDGIDSITLRDELDKDLTGESETYNFNSGSMSKGTMTIGTSGIERQGLFAANGLNPGLNFTPIINLNAFESLVQTMFVQGGGSRAVITNAPNGFAALPALVSLNHKGDAYVNEFNAGGLVNAYTVELVNLHKDSTGQVFRFSVDNMTLDASSVVDNVVIDSLQEANLTINGNGGGDTFAIGNGSITQSISKPVTINGGAGSDIVTIANDEAESFAQQTLNGATFTYGLFSHAFNTIELLNIFNGSGGSNVVVNSILQTTNINGGIGSDNFTVGGGDIDANIPASTATAPALVIDAGGGTDSIRFDDFNDNVTANDSYTFQRPNGVDQLRRHDVTDVFINWLNIEGVTLDQSNAPQVGNFFSVTSVNSSETPLRINGNGGLDSIMVEDAVTPLILHTGLGERDNLFINSDGDAIPANVIIEQSDDIENLTISPDGTLRITSNAVVVKTRLGLNPDVGIFGELDLAGGSFLSRAGGPSLGEFQTWLTNGFNNGSWNGTNAQGAINSSLAANATLSTDAVGYGLASDIAINTIGGFNIAPGDLLLRYTLNGDANLDQSVNFNDLLRLSQNYNPSAGNKSWSQGNFNYNTADNAIGAVGFADLLSLSQNYNDSVATLFGNARIRIENGWREIEDDIEQR